ncbi:MAG TPA: L-rhamnose isomerase [Bacteroidales bacterium]|nr:L-rhamnose isomerase [Bacteroidales bacterium]HQK36323.1 L-rhamnose isomerase [Bacteroidales bacterium]
MKNQKIEKAYSAAREVYANLGVDTDKVLEILRQISISLHCWQADDVGGFEKPDAALSGGGIQATGNYPGKARNIDELRKDLEFVFSLLPGKHRFNLHAIYGDFGKKFVDRNQIEPKHFKSWVDWAKKNGLGLDFNCTCFSHPLANDGFTLSSKDKKIREFWIEHVRRCREISAYMGKELKKRTVHNIWIPDGTKDLTVDRLKHRELLRQSLDTIFEDVYNEKHMTDSLESKLFGIGSEAFVVGSHEFYMGYCLTRKKMICIDMGHFHPTESVADKVSSILLFSDEIMFHLSRGIRWDSDHVLSLNDELTQLALEIVRANALKRVNIGLDFFDASINRIGAYVIGTRNALKSFLFALLEPLKKLRTYEDKNQGFQKLAFMEEAKTLPWGAVWDYFCMVNDVPASTEYISEIEKYESKVLSKR